jgi:BirA family biotin operon repressor/biotin-[acetyl-CoA-carboxylase] ligase
LPGTDQNVRDNARVPVSPVPVPLSADSIRAALPPDGNRWRVETFATIDSTSDELRRRALAGPIDSLALATETQTAGRGRMGRAWVDQPGGSLLCSVGWHAPVPAPGLAGLSLAVGVAVAVALERAGAAGIQLKWPNDLLHRHCKLGGILVETVNAHGDATDVIIGIGINVRLAGAARDAVAAPVTDLAAAGWSGERNALLAAILAELASTLDRFAREGLHPYRAAWLARHALQQRNVTIWRAGHEIAAGRAIDIDDDGALLLQTAAGVRRLLSGELTLRPG